MTGRATRIALEVVAAALGIAFVLIAVAVWRLSQGPVRIDFLTPYIERSLSRPAGGPSVEVGATVLAWEGWPQTVALRVRHLRVRDAEGRVLARVPSVRLRLSLTALLAGTVAPTMIEVRDARLSLVREFDGSFHFGGLRTGRREPAGEQAPSPGSAGEAAPEGELAGVAPTVLEQMMMQPDPRRPVSYLRTIRVRNARLALDDRRMGLVWLAPQANIELQRGADGIDGQADLRVALGETPTEVEAALSYHRAARRLDVAASFRGLRPADVAAAVPELARARGVEVPLHGSLSASLGPEARVEQIGFDIVAGAGRLDMSGLLPEPVAMRGGGLRGRLDRAAGRVVIDSATLAFGDEAAPGPRLTGSAEVSGLGGDLRLEGRLASSAVPADALWRYWPLGLGGNGRDWVAENIRTGTAESVELEAVLSAPAGDPQAVRLERLDGSIEYTDLDVHYLRPLPPVRQVDGTASFDAHSLRFDAASGALGDLRVDGADIVITGLDEPDQRIDIDFRAHGPLHQALQLLDHPRLDLVAPLGLSAEGASGDADVRTQLEFPLLKDLEFENVQVRAEAELRQVSLPDLALGKDVTDGRLDLSVDRESLRVAGPMRLAGVPLSLDWRERFTDGAAPRTLIRAQVPRLDAPGRRAFGLDAPDYLQGPVAGDLTARLSETGEGEVEAAIDLQEAALDVPFLGWRKPAGEAGTLDLSLALDDGRPTALRSFALEAGGDRVKTLSVAGSARLRGEDADLGEVELTRLHYGETRLEHVAASRGEDGAWRIRLNGGVLDAEPVLDRALAADDRAADAEAGPAGEAEEPPPLGIEATNLDRLYLGPGRYIERVSLRAERASGGWWRRLLLEARLPAELMRARAGEKPPAVAGAALAVAYAPRADGVRELSVAAGDAGALLRALDVIDTVKGGNLEIRGRSRGPEPESPLDVKVEIDEFRVVDAPVLAKLLTLASLQGFGDTLSGEGIRFKRLVGKVTAADGRLQSDLLRAYGPALGITAKGEIDLRADRSDLQGTIVPAYTVNSVLGKIPVLGELLVGGKGEGVFAVTYRLRGPVGDPEITVNPLSALTPGFLRGLFGLLEGGESPDELPRALPSEPGR